VRPGSGSPEDSRVRTRYQRAISSAVVVSPDHLDDIVVDEYDQYLDTLPSEK
jgi:hypothetical protein